jgi:bifunctional UDP-N-acetylglucosamine pyrophosphorylase / glucosamine-1-phosphate N-acetyltransferase
MKVAVLILAGGMGKRMKSTTPKVLHKLNEYSILGNIIKKISDNISNDLFVVTGKCHNMIKEHLVNELGELENKINYVTQEPALGTGHALQCGFKTLSNYKGIIVINGDVPFLNINTLKNIIENSDNECILGICKMDYLDVEWRGHGRIIMEGETIEKIVEEKDCSEEQKQISTINGGLYYFNNSILSKYINDLDNNNKQKEYYITDYIGIFVKNMYKVFPVYLEKNEILNINTPEQLATAKKLLS